MTQFQRKTGIDIKKNSKVKSRLFNSCENAKKDLSFSTSTSIDLESLIDGKDFNITITRNKFEDLCQDLFNKCIPPIEMALKNGNMSKELVDDIILVGGSSRIPKIQVIAQRFF